jgi:predicted GNAT family N-acyltransferase
LKPFVYKESKDIDKKQLLSLYEDAEWAAYLAEPDKTYQAFQNSLYVITAWHNDTLVGLLRAVGDSKTILYFQDIIVLKAYKRNHIATEMVKRTIEQFKDVRQKVLITEDREETRKFYESLGFESCDKGKGQIVSFAMINRFTDGLW